MLPVSADNEAVSKDVVREDHEAKNSDNEELEVAGQKRYHKTSHGDVKDIEIPKFQLGLGLTLKSQGSQRFIKRLLKMIKMI